VDADEQQRKDIAGRVDELAESGYRTLGVVRKSGDEKWGYLGILPLLDPPRKDTAEVIEDAKNRHIDIRMVTGDHAAIAGQVANQEGLGQDIPDASSFFTEEDISEEKQREIVKTYSFRQWSRAGEPRR
jgi:H+-transporting ATPase